MQCGIHCTVLVHSYPHIYIKLFFFLFFLCPVADSIELYFFFFFLFFVTPIALDSLDYCHFYFQNQCLSLGSLGHYHFYFQINIYRELKGFYVYVKLSSLIQTYPPPHSGLPPPE